MAKSGQHGGNVLQMAQKFGFSPQDIIDFSANINPLGMPLSVKSAIINRMNEAEHYPDIEYTVLYQKIAAFYACKEQNLIVGNGASELIYEWVAHLAPRHALLLEPSFSEYRRALKHYHCDIKTYPLREENRFLLDDDFLDELNDNLDCLMLCSPNNPTGQCIPYDLLLRILEKAQQHHIAVMVDESFIDFIPQHQSLLTITNDYPNLYLLRSLTKFFAIPGLRLGFMISGNTEIMAALRTHQKPWTINCFAAIAGEVIFDDEQYVTNTHCWLEAEQQRLMHALSAFPQLALWQPAANYLFFKCNDEDVDLQTELMKHKILIRSCANYPQLNEHYYRIAIKSKADNQRLIDAIAAVLHHG